MKIEFEVNFTAVVHELLRCCLNCEGKTNLFQGQLFLNKVCCLPHIQIKIAQSVELIIHTIQIINIY